MIYKASATLNKALNPELFSGQNSKVVNAINKLAKDFATLEAYVNSTTSKNNNVILDVHTDINAVIWEETQELMGAETIIEGINKILKGEHQHNLLGLTADDIDKVLTVAQDDEGKLITKAIPLGELGYTADAVKYENEALPEVHTVEDAINFILTNGVGSSPGNIIVDWDAIQNKPEVPNELVLSEGVLEMKSGDEVLSSIDITMDSDIEDILNDLE
jgi:hypothetical protein